MDPTDHEHAILLADLAPDMPAEQALPRIDPTRLQRASKGAGQSATRGGHDVIEGRGDFAVRVGTVVLLDRAMDSELDRAFVRR